MKNGFVLPFGDARMAADMASLAEQHGWDGFFVWEPVWGNDAWVMLTAAAMTTERIRLGTMLTPLSRMKPWKLASETATLDNLSGGRVTLAVGLGAPDTGWEAFGEITDRRTRAELLDEGLDVLTGLWQGQPFAYAGKHYQVQPTDFMVPAPPVQQPRIPIWVVGAWPYPKSMARALRYDGLIPSMFGGDGKAMQATPEALREMLRYVEANRPPENKGPAVRHRGGRRDAGRRSGGRGGDRAAVGRGGRDMVDRGAVEFGRTGGSGGADQGSDQAGAAWGGVNR